MTDPKRKLIIAPGAFDDFDGTQEELAEMLALVKQMMEDGTLEENSRPIPPEEAEEIWRQIEEKRNTRQ